MTFKEIEKKLLDDGWYETRQKGSHHHYKHAAKSEKISVPDCGDDDINPNIVSQIFKQEGKTLNLFYVAVFTPYEDGTDGFTVEFPDLPGCVTGGDNMEEAVRMASDAACGWIFDELENRNYPPEARGMNDIPTTVIGQLKIPISVDTDTYVAKCGKAQGKVVEKTLVIPAWVDNYVESNRTSYVSLLQDAIIKTARP